MGQKRVVGKEENESRSTGKLKRKKKGMINFKWERRDWLRS